jgi:hypothetical protein
LTRNTTSITAASAFPDKHPIGIDPTGRAVLLYIVLPSARDDFRAFLDRHRKLLTCLPSWTLRLVFPHQLSHLYETYQAVVREEWETPLHLRTVEELTWYFERRRAISGRIRPGSDERLDRAAQAFERPRFYRLYGRWQREGDRAFTDVTSTAISAALAARTGRLECLVLPHRYDHLSPLVDVLGSTSRTGRALRDEISPRMSAQTRLDTGDTPRLLGTP